jgi:hypothetical protein
MDLGFVYFVFAPSVVATLFAGRAIARFGPLITAICSQPFDHRP